MKFCSKCGSELPDKCKSCNNCGTKIKKPVFKKWWFWLIVIFIFLIIISSGDTESSVEDNSNGTTLSFEEEIATYYEIDFDSIARNPDKYKGEKLKMTGQVIQVSETGYGNTVDLRINVTKETYEYIDDVTWTDTIYATVVLPEGSDRILEEDVITFYGVCDGLYSYTSVLGAQISLPKIDIKYWEFGEK